MTAYDAERFFFLLRFLQSIVIVCQGKEQGVSDSNDGQIATEKSQ